MNFADGVFHGRWLKFERMLIELAPAWPALPGTLAASPTWSDGQLRRWSAEEAAILFPGYHAAWNLPVGTRGNGMIWLLDPCIARSDLDACGVDHEDWIFPHLQAAEGAVCLDLASFVGTVAVWWAKQGVNVIAVEPIPRTRDTLYRNIELNQVTDRITVIPKAFGNQVGQLRMASGDANSHINEDGDCLVDATTIDAELLPVLKRLDVIKLDVEGAECDVIDGAKDTIRRFKPRLVIEVHSHLPGCEANGSSLTRQFAELGYRSRRIWQNTEAYYYVEAVPND